MFEKLEPKLTCKSTELKSDSYYIQKINDKFRQAYSLRKGGIHMYMQQNSFRCA